MEAISSKSASLFALSVVVLYVVHKTLNVRKHLASVGYHPGVRTLFPQVGALINLLPRMPYITHGRNHMFRNKFDRYEEYGWDILASASVFPEQVTVNVANAAAIKEITFSRARFPKPVHLYKTLQMFGGNIIASEGELWKKYRKIAAPAFNDRNNKLVWDETVRIVLDLFDSVWMNRNVEVDHAVDITLPIALFVIGVAGFGRKISWKDDMVLSPGHQLTFKEALSTFSRDILFIVACPKWLMGVTERLRRVNLACEELERYMLEMINERRDAEKKEERYDLFSSLLDANDSPSDDTDVPLTERELMGNIFIFLLAGHETTAHTLAFTFGLLAFYQEEQEILYQHIKSIIPDGRIPTYEEMPLFAQSMAVFYETLRLFPPVCVIPKMSAEDTTLVAENAVGETKVVPVPQGTSISLSVVGLHYNPKYWKDPHEFRPSRFREEWPRDAFLPFSGGARACIGRKFFETEGIAILTMLVSKYKISFKEEPQFAGETMEEKKARVFATKPGLTISPIRMPLVFTRRT
ncbi:hypothetical protein PM082_004822 [Marasmius tenuissimus]|nr:hypothetical protein PM082_004822 [Marasmius tenuissimus]